MRKLASTGYESNSAVRDNLRSQTSAQPKGVAELVHRRAGVAPDAPAVVACRRVLTYAELEIRANQLANYLCAIGARLGFPIGVCLERSPDMIVSLLAILKTGAAFVPMDPSYPADRLAFMLNDTRTPLLITRRRFLERLPNKLVNCHYVVIDANAAQIAAQSAAAPQIMSAVEDLVYVIYTSGSTGRPKGVQINMAGLLNLINWHCQAFSVTSNDRASQITSPGFDAAVWEVWPYLTSGASVHFVDDDIRSSPEMLRDWLVAHSITIGFVPTMLAERLIQMEWPANTSLRTLLTGGDILHSYPAPNLPFVLINNYGPTEATVVATSGPVLNEHRDQRLPTIGRAIANTQIYILDDQLRPVPPGSAGELCIAGKGLARGYVNDPELTAAKFIPNHLSGASGERLYRTGDVAQNLSDGRIVFLGRIDDQVKVRGYRIELGEIVSVLDSHPAVSNSAVVTRKKDGDECLVAYVVLSGIAQVSARALQDFVRNYVPDHMVPSMFVRLDSMPLTHNGKVDRAALPAPSVANIIVDGNVSAPRSPVEERVLSILTNLLGTDRVAIDDNFFLLGGHSLLGAQVITQIRDAFGVELPLRSIFDSPTVAELSSRVEHLLLAKIDAMTPEEVNRALRQI